MLRLFNDLEIDVYVTVGPQEMGECMMEVLECASNINVNLLSVSNART